MSLNNSTSKRVMNLLEPVKLIVWKVVIELQYSSFEWTMEVAMALDVLKSRYGQIQLSSGI